MTIKIYSGRIWVISIIYFFFALTFSLTITVIFTSIFYSLGSGSNLLAASLQQIIRMIIDTLLSYALGIYLSSILIIKLFKQINAQITALVSTIFFTGIVILFFLKDVFIRDINGMPIMRNYPQEIMTGIISCVGFYFLSLLFLQYFSKK